MKTTMKFEKVTTLQLAELLQFQEKEGWLKTSTSSGYVFVTQEDFNKTVNAIDTDRFRFVEVLDPKPNGDGTYNVPVAVHLEIWVGRERKEYLDLDRFLKFMRALIPGSFPVPDRSNELDEIMRCMRNLIGCTFEFPLYRDDTPLISRKVKLSEMDVFLKIFPNLRYLNWKCDEDKPPSGHAFEEMKRACDVARRIGL